MPDVTVRLTGQSLAAAPGTLRPHIGRVPEGYNKLPQLLDYLKAQPLSPITEWAIGAIKGTLSAPDPSKEIARAFELRKYRGERNKSGPRARSVERREEIAQFMHDRITGASQRWGSVEDAKQRAAARYGITPGYAGMLYRNWRKKK